MMMMILTFLPKILLGKPVALLPNLFDPDGKILSMNGKILSMNDKMLSMNGKILSMNGKDEDDAATQDFIK